MRVVGGLKTLARQEYGLPGGAAKAQAQSERQKRGRRREASSSQVAANLDAEAFTTSRTRSDGPAPMSRNTSEGEDRLREMRGWSSYALTLDLTNEHI
jgi:hypothetical protein